MIFSRILDSRLTNQISIMKLTLNALLFQRRYRQPWYEEIFYDVINGNIIVIILNVLFLVFIISLFKKTLKEYHSRWNTLINNFEFSSQEFYTMLREELKSHGVTDITIVTRRFSEGAMLSGKRLYLIFKFPSKNRNLLVSSLSRVSNQANLDLL